MNLLNDQLYYALRCRGSSKIEIMFSFRTGKYPSSNGVFLAKGGQFISEDRIDVAIRIDKGKLIEEGWSVWNNKSASNFSNERYYWLLDEIAKGQRVVVRVGKEGGVIDLKGSAAAVADFKKRIASHKKPSLLSPAQSTKLKNKAESTKKPTKNTNVSNPRRSVQSDLNDKEE